MKIYDIMSRSVKTVTEQATMGEAARLMMESNVGMLPVLNAYYMPIGVVTDRDIALRAAVDHIGLAAPIRDIMSPVRFTIRQQEEIDRALDLMRQHQVGRLIVTDNGGALVGVVSLHDIAMFCKDGSQTADVHSALRSRVPTEPAQRISLS